MAAAVSIGQITIKDQNDLKPINTYIKPNNSTLQYYNDDASNTFTPNYMTTPIKYEVFVYQGDQVNKASVTNAASRKWSIAGSACFVNGTAQAALATVLSTYFSPGASASCLNATEISMTIAGNLKTDMAAPTLLIAFEATITDPFTTIDQVAFDTDEISINTRGISAVTAKINGPSVIMRSDNASGGKVVLYCDLTRSSTGAVDNNAGITYAWYKQPYGASDQLDYLHSDAASGYIGFADYAAWNANPTTLVLGKFLVGAGRTPNPINSTYAPRSFLGTGKAICLSEDAITDVQTIKCVVSSTYDTGTFVATHSIEDTGDLWDTKIKSSASESLMAGVASTNLTPLIWTGQRWVSDFTGFSFKWTVTNRDGKKAFFVDNNYWSSAGALGKPILSHSTSGFTIDTNVTLVAGAIIKCVKLNGVEAYYETQVVTNASYIPLRLSGQVQGINNSTDYPYPPNSTDFVGGRLYICRNDNPGSAASVTVTCPTATVVPLTIFAADIDGVGSFYCDVFPPTHVAY